MPCPGRGAAFFMPLRRAGTVTDAGAWYGPGSAKHHAAKSGVLHRARDTETPLYFTSPSIGAILATTYSEPSAVRCAWSQASGTSSPTVRGHCRAGQIALTTDT